METLERLLPLIVTVLNGLGLLYFAWKKNKPEVKKMDAEADSEIVEAAERNLEGAKISNQMLVDRINDLKTLLDTEREQRKTDLQQEREQRKAELDAEKEARRKEVDYLRRRIRDAEREARDYRQWAAKLVKQVVEAGKVPAAFIPSTADDSETGMNPITKGEK